MSHADNGDSAAVATGSTREPHKPGDPAAPPPNPMARIRLGEELPVFCERCGYSLHGLPHVRCGACDVLHFACPECNHHQPINTLRPAFQRMLGRLRSFALAYLVVVKINLFFWPLFGWAALGTEIAYRYASGGRGGGYRYEHDQFVYEGAVIIFLFAAGFGMLGRMALLRWRRGAFVGTAIGALVAFAMYAGAYFQYLMYLQSPVAVDVPRPESDTLFIYMLCGFAGATAGAACVWGVWVSLVHVFLPRRTADALLEWQRSQSAPLGSPDRTDATTSVTA
jgi:hypothetical protein